MNKETNQNQQQQLIKVDFISNKDAKSDLFNIQDINSDINTTNLQLQKQNQTQIQKQRKSLYLNNKKHQFNQQYIIDTIAEELCLELKNKDSLKTLQNDLLQLQTLVNSNRNFKWEKVANKLKIDRWALYRFWNETLQRQIRGQIDYSDKLIIEKEIEAAIINNIQMDKQWQSQVKQKLSKEYHRSSFSITFNNLKRKVLRVIQKRLQGISSKNNTKKSQFEIDKQYVQQQIQSQYGSIINSGSVQYGSVGQYGRQQLQQQGEQSQQQGQQYQMQYQGQQQTQQQYYDQYFNNIGENINNISNNISIGNINNISNLANSIAFAQFEGQQNENAFFEF